MKTAEEKIWKESEYVCVLEGKDLKRCMRCESEVACVERASWRCLEWVSVIQLVGKIGCCRLVNLVVVIAYWSSLLLQTGQACCCCRLVNLVVVAEWSTVLLFLHTGQACSCILANFVLAYWSTLLLLQNGQPFSIFDWHKQAKLLR